MLVALLFASSLLLSQGQAAKEETIVRVRVRAVLVDKDLNQKPVPHLTVAFSSLEPPTAEPILIKTALDGNAELQLRAGKYRLTTPEPIEFKGKKYGWDFEVKISGPETTIELSNDSAKSSDLPPPPPSRRTDELTLLFQRLENSVVTVWTEMGHGTGFFVDQRGLILTNQHVVGPSELISVQFDAKRKVPAKLLAFSPKKDVAVLWADLSLLPEAIIAPIAKAEGGEAPVVEGERVFTIGSPLSQRKIITSGVASKIEARAIISDININHGNSGGPLFNSLGQVVGITTFGEPDRGRPGLSGIVRIEEALPLIDQARKKMSDQAPPEARLLPVEPTDSFPLDAIKEAIQAEKFDAKPYLFGAGDYDVAMITPVLQYREQERTKIEAAKEKAKRTRKKADAVKETFQPLQDLKDWAEYIGEYKPILLIQANPKIRETFWSAFGRGLAASSGGYAGPARLKFKTDFYRMRLLCGEKVVEPIQPAKIAKVIDAHNYFVNVTDATYSGFYSYPADVISPSCGQVRLELYSEKEPNKPTVKVIDPKAVNRIWSDFEPYRQAHKPEGTN